MLGVARHPARIVRIDGLGKPLDLDAALRPGYILVHAIPLNVHRCQVITSTVTMSERPRFAGKPFGSSPTIFQVTGSCWHLSDSLVDRRSVKRS